MLETKGERIKKVRKKLGLSQIELANKLGYKSRSVICDIEKNRQSFPVSRLEKLASILKVSADYLIGKDDNSTNNNILNNNNVKNSNIKSHINIGVSSSTIVPEVEKIEELLKRILKMKNKGLITEEQYEQKRKEILERI